MYYSTACTPDERARVTNAALAFNKYADDGRAANTPVVEVEPGAEPVRFCLQFKNWSARKATKEQEAEVFLDHTKKFTYRELLHPESLPEWVDRACLEDYLTDQEFRAVFGMERSEFNLQPRWKKEFARRKHSLY